MALHFVPWRNFWRDAKMDQRDAGSTGFAMSLMVCIICFN
jgi:hypothetical protein